MWVQAIVGAGMWALVNWCAHCPGHPYVHIPFNQQMSMAGEKVPKSVANVVLAVRVMRVTLVQDSLELAPLCPSHPVCKWLLQQPEFCSLLQEYQAKKASGVSMDGGVRPALNAWVPSFLGVSSCAGFSQHSPRLTLPHFLATAGAGPPAPQEHTPRGSRCEAQHGSAGAVFGGGRRERQPAAANDGGISGR